jgi:hypothetical protein
MTVKVTVPPNVGAPFESVAVAETKLRPVIPLDGAATEIVVCASTTTAVDLRLSGPTQFVPLAAVSV